MVSLPPSPAPPPGETPAASPARAEPEMAPSPAPSSGEPAEVRAPVEPGRASPELRRSSRTTFGRHANPHHLPKSSLPPPLPPPHCPAGLNPVAGTATSEAGGECNRPDNAGSTHSTSPPAQCPAPPAGGDRASPTAPCPLAPETEPISVSFIKTGQLNRRLSNPPAAARHEAPHASGWAYARAQTSTSQGRQPPHTSTHPTLSCPLCCRRYQPLRV